MIQTITRKWERNSGIKIEEENRERIPSYEGVLQEFQKPFRSLLAWPRPMHQRRMAGKEEPKWLVGYDHGSPHVAVWSPLSMNRRLCAIKLEAGRLIDEMKWEQTSPWSTSCLDSFRNRLKLQFRPVLFLMFGQIGHIFMSLILL